MEQIYRLSPGAMLYAVLRLHKSGIYGLLDVFTDMPEAQFPACIQNAEQELFASGWGMMDFDGNFTLDTKFAELVSRCADENAVLHGDKRKNGHQERFTFYLNAGAVLTQENGLCILRETRNVAEAALDFLDLPEETDAALREVTVDSGLVASRNAAGLMDAGCDETLAQLLVDSAAGKGGYAQFVRIVDRMQTHLLAFAWGDAGTVGINVQYTEHEELFHILPLSARQAGAEISTIAAL